MSEKIVMLPINVPEGDYCYSHKPFMRCENFGASEFGGGCWCDKGIETEEDDQISCKGGVKKPQTCLKLSDQKE